MLPSRCCSLVGVCAVPGIGGRPNVPGGVAWIGPDLHFAHRVVAAVVAVAIFALARTVRRRPQAPAVTLMVRVATALIGALASAFAVGQIVALVGMTGGAGQD